MLKVNLIYPVIIKKNLECFSLESKDFSITVESETLGVGIAQIKQQIVLRLAELAKKKENPPIPKISYSENIAEQMAYIEIDSNFIKYNCERINVSIPSNLLAQIDAFGINRSNYISNLILTDILKKCDK
jgi:hypothetical protein